MPYFKGNILEQNILEDTLAWQKSYAASNSRMIQALAVIIKRLAEEIDKD